MRSANAAALLAALPWLNPNAGGLSPTLQAWLVSATCALAPWLLAVRSGARFDAVAAGLAARRPAVAAFAAQHWSWQRCVDQYAGLIEDVA